MDQLTPSPWTFKRFDRNLISTWDTFVENARNATFLHMRSYMDYHASRFTDHSLLAYHNGSLKAILPANITPDATIHSHKGLTYGGWLLPQHGFNGEMMLSLWLHALQHLQAEGIKSLNYNPTPYIYHTSPSQEDIYILWRLQAAPSAQLLASVAERAEGPRFDTMRRRHLRNALKNEIYIKEITGSITPFWEMLTNCLNTRHDACPVHSLKEITSLRSSFPDNIKFIGAFSPDHTLQAGICLYISRMVAHCQYIATTPEGRASHALAPLSAALFQSPLTAHCRYIDFGTSNENGGLTLNLGLNANKTGYGATGVAYSQYSIPTSAWTLL